MSDTNDRKEHDPESGRWAKGNSGGSMKRLLTVRRHTRIVELVADSNYLSTSARASGVAPKTLRGWLRRGQDEHEAGKKTPFSKLFTDIRKAAAESEAKLVEMVKTAAVLGFKQTRVNRKTSGTGEVVTHEEITTVPPDWRAGIALLQARSKTRFGVKRLEVAGGVQHTHLVMSEEDEAVARRIIERRFGLGEDPAPSPDPASDRCFGTLLLPPAPGQDEEAHGNGQK